jgi:hypothetical protein
MSVDPIVKTFHEEVNMTPSALEKHLDTPESKEVGWKAHEGAESVGHKEGHKIVELLHTKQGELSEDDLKHMHKVVGYIHRHMAQRPEGDVTDTNWRTSLMNWGHDPLKE